MKRDSILWLLYTGKQQEKLFNQGVSLCVCMCVCVSLSLSLSVSPAS